MIVPVAGAAGAAVIVLVLLLALLVRRPRTDIDRFAAARALTTRWADDAGNRGAAGSAQGGDR